MNQRHLDPQAFLGVVAQTPLVSIDLLVVDRSRRLLLGRRRNEPACGFWFVPGGRICKGETFAAAFARISAAELGQEMELGAAAAAGVFEHFYHENFARVPGITTHYVVLAWRLSVDERRLSLPEEQHSAYRWVTADELAADETIHRYTRDYAALLDDTVR